MLHKTFPEYVSKYFWGDDLNELSLDNHENYILQTLLNIGDQKAISWLFSNVSKSTIKEKLPQLKLSKKSANFWHIYLS